jgi:hypothetical protein
MEHCLQDKLKDYWATTSQLDTPFYSNMMKQDRYHHILRLLHFTDNRNELGRTDENFDRLKNLKPFWNSKHSIFQIIQTFRKSVHAWSYCFMYRKRPFQMLHTEETQLFWHKNLQTLWLSWIHMTWNCVWRRTENSWHSIWQQPMWQ